MNCEDLMNLSGIKDKFDVIKKVTNNAYKHFSLQEKEKFFKIAIHDIYELRDNLTSNFLDGILDIVKKMLYIEAESNDRLDSYNEDLVEIIKENFFHCNPFFNKNELYENYIVPVESNYDELILTVPKKYFSNPNWEEEYKKKTLEQAKISEAEKKRDSEYQQYLKLKKKFESK